MTYTNVYATFLNFYAFLCSFYHFFTHFLEISVHFRDFQPANRSPLTTHRSPLSLPPILFHMVKSQRQNPQNHIILHTPLHHTPYTLHLTLYTNDIHHTFLYISKIFLPSSGSLYAFVATRYALASSNRSHGIRVAYPCIFSITCTNVPISR